MDFGQTVEKFNFSTVQAEDKEHLFISQAATNLRLYPRAQAQHQLILRCVFFVAGKASANRRENAGGGSLALAFPPSGYLGNIGLLFSSVELAVFSSPQTSEELLHSFRLCLHSEFLNA